jgi:putative resolvase
MEPIESCEITDLIIAHNDGLVRFGLQWFERLCAEHGTELLVLNNEQLSPEQEMVQDLPDNRSLLFGAAIWSFGTSRAWK